MALFGQLMIISTLFFSALGFLTIFFRSKLVLTVRNTGDVTDEINCTKHLVRLFLKAATVSSILAVLSLLFLLVSFDYRVAYVADYAQRQMPSSYLITALWGGRQGSLLVWAFLQTVFTLVFSLSSRWKKSHLFFNSLAILTVLQIFFFTLTLFHSNPFGPAQNPALFGTGMNPLLRNPFMALHPPTLYIGFVGFCVPFSVAASALLDKNFNYDWILDLRPFILFAWLFLTIGNILGMVWAYEELGWGGYWGWDPVENASFIPWLFATALVHSVIGVKHTKVFKFSSIIFMGITFVSIIFGTFLTRSGIIESVHTFAGSSTGPYFLGLMVISIVLFTVGLFIKFYYLKNAQNTEKKQPEGSLNLRTVLISYANYIFVLAAFFVFFATMTPLFSQLISGEKITLLPEFFNKWMIPLGLAILGLTGFCSFLSWKNFTLKNLLGLRFILPLALALLAAFVFTFVNASNKPYCTLSVGFIAFVGAISILEIVKNFHKNKKKAGGYMVHFGIAIMFAGFTGSAFSSEEANVLKKGQTMHHKEYDIKLLRTRYETDWEKSAVMADLEVRKNGTHLGVFSPARHVYKTHPGQPLCEVEIHTGVTRDLFLILGEVEHESKSAFVKTVINPMVSWIWFGGLIVVLGVLTASGSLKKINFNWIKHTYKKPVFFYVIVFCVLTIFSFATWGYVIGTAALLGCFVFLLCRALVTFVMSISVNLKQ